MYDDDDFLVQRDRIIEKYLLDGQFNKLKEEQLNEAIACIIKKENDICNAVNAIKNGEWKMLCWKVDVRTIDLVEIYPHIPNRKVIASCVVCDGDLYYIIYHLGYSFNITPPEIIIQNGLLNFVIHKEKAEKVKQMLYQGAIECGIELPPYQDIKRPYGGGSS